MAYLDWNIENQKIQKTLGEAHVALRLIRFEIESLVARSAVR